MKNPQCFCYEQIVRAKAPTRKSLADALSFLFLTIGLFESAKDEPPINTRKKTSLGLSLVAQNSATGVTVAATPPR